MDSIRNLLGLNTNNNNNNNIQIPSSVPSPSSSSSPNSNNNNKDKDNTNNKPNEDEKFSGFDPRGLERAAKAAKELEQSPLGKDAVVLARDQEKTSQLKYQATVEENRARTAAFMVEQARVQEEERRRTLEAEHRAAQQNAQYQDQLARKRAQDQLQAQQAMHAQELKRQEESAIRIEQLKRESAQYEASLRKETDLARAKAEAEGRIQQERANFDLTLQKSKADAKEFRVTVLEGIREAGTVIGDGTRDFLSDPKKIGTVVVMLSAAAVGVYSAKVSTGIIGRFIESRLGKPPLVRETSRKTLMTYLTSPIQSIRSRLFTTTNALDAVKGVVLHPELKSRLENLASTTVNTKRNRAPYRNVLLYGPPGTGKTMFAKNLAQASGMDFAIMTGGDVAPLGRDAVTEIHKLFDWASTSRKGVLIFVDEADAFLRKRASAGNALVMSEDARNALNAFLYRTGSENKDYMLIFATNLPDQLDFAVSDRADEAVPFVLPGLEERLQLIKMYFNKNVKQAGLKENASWFSRSRVQILLDKPLEDKLDGKLADIAHKIHGFSGREIAKLSIAIQAAAYGTPNATLTEELLDKVVGYRIEGHIQKRSWHLGSETFGDKAPDEG
jgi:ATPase family AAA domain-containing protein 3A/B